MRKFIKNQIITKYFNVEKYNIDILSKLEKTIDDIGDKNDMEQ